MRRGNGKFWVCLGGESTSEDTVVIIENLYQLSQKLSASFKLRGWGNFGLKQLVRGYQLFSILRVRGCSSSKYPSGTIGFMRGDNDGRDMV